MLNLQQLKIQSERLNYRLLEQRDKPALFEMLADQSVTLPAGFAPLATPEQAEDFYTTLTAYNTAVGIFHGEALVGYVHANKYVVEQPDYVGKKCVNLGIVIGKKYQRRGFGTEALATVTEALKTTLDFCFAGHFTENVASQKMIAKCGYRFFEQYDMYFECFGRDKTICEYVY